MYKRQCRCGRRRLAGRREFAPWGESPGIGLAAERRETSWRELLRNDPGPVSYTHLDVYKRQILVAVVGVVVGALLQAQHATQGVAYEANTQENLRAGMHFMVQDLLQAGEGIPQGGISVPYDAAGNSAIVRPGVFPPTGPDFPNPVGNGFTLMPAISPGSQIGQDATTVDPVTGAVLNGNLQTDVINILYADNSLQDAAGHYLYSFPVVQAVGPPACAGTIDPVGGSVLMDVGCFVMPGVTQPITVGNLIMFHNSNGTALEYVTGVAGQTILLSLIHISRAASCCVFSRRSRLCRSFRRVGDY